MFHCLLRPGEARSIERIDTHIFDDIQASRCEVIFGVRFPKSRRQSFQVQHVLVECQNFALLLRWRQIRPAEKNGAECSTVPPMNMPPVSVSQVFGEVEPRIIGFDCGTCQRFEDVEDVGKVRPRRRKPSASSVSYRTAPATTLTGHACSVIFRAVVAGQSSFSGSNTDSEQTPLLVSRAVQGPGMAPLPLVTTHSWCAHRNVARCLSVTSLSLDTAHKDA